MPALRVCGKLCVSTVGSDSASGSSERCTEEAKCGVDFEDRGIKNESVFGIGCAAEMQSTG